MALESFTYREQYSFLLHVGEQNCDSLHSGASWQFQSLLLLSREISSNRERRLGQYLLPAVPTQTPLMMCSALYQNTPNKERDCDACCKTRLFLPASKFQDLARCCWQAPQPITPAHSMHVYFPSFCGVTNSYIIHLSLEWYTVQ